MAKDKQGILSISEKSQFQRRLSWFLKNYRKNNNLTSKELAKKLGYTPPRYSEIEKANNIESRFCNVLEFLSSIYSLEGMSLSEFALFLEGETRIHKESKSGTLPPQELYKWEKNILRIFDRSDTILRDAFIQRSEDDDIVNLCLKLIYYTKHLEKKDFEKFIEGIRVLIDKQ